MLIIRSPSPRILSTGTVPKTYTRDSDLTKASSTVTLGPFHSLPPTLGPMGVEQSPFHIHYETTVPIMGYRSLKRSAEVSHWGNNLNIQDEIDLVNMGPKCVSPSVQVSQSILINRLKGHFSRLAHQQSKFHASSPAQVFTDLTLRLPPTAHTTYYYDTIGNVSTSRFRPGQTPATQAKSKSRTAARIVDSQLELKPRYPILGGWNYSFVIGYDVPLSDMLRSDGGRKVLSVPFLTGYKDLAAEEVELKIVLPEGARYVVSLLSPCTLSSPCFLQTR
jgi:oligosaccharyltransferase complex subunit alpha (ribophorin I)